MSANPRMKPLERKVLRDTVYESLVDMLMSGTLAPGASLSIDGLASGLAVSPTPVREALVQLERTGLVFREPLRGYRVAPLLDTDQVAQLCDARAIVEPCGLGRSKRCYIGVFCKQVLYHNVHPGIGALGRQPYRHKQLPRMVIIQRAVGIGIFCLQARNTDCSQLLFSHSIFSVSILFS